MSDWTVIIFMLLISIDAFVNHHQIKRIKERLHVLEIKSIIRGDLLK